MAGNAYGQLTLAARSRSLVRAAWWMTATVKTVMAEADQ
jgi:hypothetical protein